MLSEAPGSAQHSLGASFSFCCVLQMIIAPHFSLLCLCDHYAPAVFRLRVGVPTFNLLVEWPVLLQFNGSNVTSLYAFLAYRFRKVNPGVN